MKIFETFFNYELRSSTPFSLVKQLSFSSSIESLLASRTVSSLGLSIASVSSNKSCKLFFKEFLLVAKGKSIFSEKKQISTFI